MKRLALVSQPLFSLWRNETTQAPFISHIIHSLFRMDSLRKSVPVVLAWNCWHDSFFLRFVLCQGDDWQSGGLALLCSFVFPSLFLLSLVGLPLAYRCSCRIGIYGQVGISCFQRRIRHLLVAFLIVVAQLFTDRIFPLSAQDTSHRVYLTVRMFVGNRTHRLLEGLVECSV